MESGRDNLKASNMIMLFVAKVIVNVQSSRSTDNVFWCTEVPVKRGG